MEANREYGWGIVGCGVIAPTHARAVAALSNAHLVAVTDVNPGKAKALADEHGAAWDADLGALLARPDIDVVSVWRAGGTPRSGSRPPGPVSTWWSRSPSTLRWPLRTGCSVPRLRLA